MQPITLRMSKPELQRALQTLSTNRRRRFSSVLPVWLSFNAATKELEIQEEGGVVKAQVPAEGSWPPAGATVDLYMLKRALAVWRDDNIDLQATEDAILLSHDRRQVRLNLLTFGPESQRKDDKPKSNRP